MPTDIQKYVPLRTIVAYALDEQDKSGGDFDKCWILAFRALVHLGQSIAWEPITVRIPVNGNMTATLPSDYIGWSKIGILTDDGKVSTLKISTSISTFKDTNPNRLDYLTPDINTQIPLLLSAPFFFNYFDNGYYYNLYGVGGGLLQYGECRVDEQNGIIVFPPDFKYSSIILEYLSSPQKNGDYTITIGLQEAVIAFIKWKLKTGSRDEYYAAAEEGRRTLPGKKVTLQIIAEVVRENGGMFLKA